MSAVRLLTNEGIVEVEQPGSDMPIALLSVKQVAEHYKRNGRCIRVAEVYRALREGKIQGYKINDWNWVCAHHELPEEWPGSE